MPDAYNPQEATATTATLFQRYLIVSYPLKIDALRRILEVENSAENLKVMLIFTRAKNETEIVAEILRTPRGDRFLGVPAQPRIGLRACPTRPSTPQTSRRRFAYWPP